MVAIDIFNLEDGLAFYAGQTIFERGEPGNEMYIVLDGELEVHLSGAVIATVGAGGVVGEMSLIDHQPRSATVIAKTDGTFVPVDEKRFLFLVRETPQFALDLLKVFTARLRSMNERCAPK